MILFIIIWAVFCILVFAFIFNLRSDKPTKEIKENDRVKFQNEIYTVKIIVLDTLIIFRKNRYDCIDRDQVQDVCSLDAASLNIVKFSLCVLGLIVATVSAIYVLKILIIEYILKL